jgi:hypothetical protein
MCSAEASCGSDAKVRLWSNMGGFLSGSGVSIRDFLTSMRHYLTLIFVLIFCLTGCGPKPYYKTGKGKKKQKYYNSIQYGGNKGEIKRPH